MPCCGTYFVGGNRKVPTQTCAHIIEDLSHQEWSLSTLNGEGVRVMRQSSSGVVG